MKRIFVLSGDRESKNLFAKLVRYKLNLWTRHKNPYDNLKNASELLKNKFPVKSREYFDELLWLLDQVNERYNFKMVFALDEVQDFLKSDKAQLLILHGYDSESGMIEELRKKFEVCTLHVTNSGKSPLSSTPGKYDYVLVTSSESFEDDVKKMLGFNLPEMEAKLKSENQN